MSYHMYICVEDITCHKQYGSELMDLYRAFTHRLTYFPFDL